MVALGLSYLAALAKNNEPMATDFELKSCLQGLDKLRTVESESGSIHTRS